MYSRRFEPLINNNLPETPNVNEILPNVFIKTICERRPGGQPSTKMFVCDSEGSSLRKESGLIIQAETFQKIETLDNNQNFLVGLNFTGDKWQSFLINKKTGRSIIFQETSSKIGFDEIWQDEKGQILMIKQKTTALLHNSKNNRLVAEKQIETVYQLEIDTRNPNQTLYRLKKLDKKPILKTYAQSIAA